jgi:hypothetical protein
MEVAQRLLEKFEVYLKDFIGTPSLIFETENVSRENYASKDL